MSFFGSDNNAERYILASGAAQQTAIIPLVVISG
jgi:hypothetical protein